MAKPKPERVDPDIARRALFESDYRWQYAWTQYIVLHYRATGNLAPGCDMRDLSEWYSQHGYANNTAPRKR